MDFLKHHKIIMASAAIASLGIIFFTFWSVYRSNKLTQVAAVKMDLQEEVTGTGTVKPAESVDMAFERGGTIAATYHQVGDNVIPGDPIIALNAADILAQLAQAEADIKTQQARLDQLKNGARSEDLANQNITIQNANTALSDAERGMLDKLQDAYTKSDDAVRGKSDQMFSNPQSTNPQLNFSIADSRAKADIELSRAQVEATLKIWQSSLNPVSNDDNFSVLVNDAKTNLGQIKSFLEKLSLAINNPNNCMIDGQGMCQNIPANWKLDISTARSNINSAISNITSGAAALDTAGANLSLAEQGLTIKEAGATDEEITAQEAQLDRAKATADLVHAGIAKTTLRSPIYGTISRQEGKIGAIASPNMPLVSVISNSRYQIEIFVSETNIAKIKTGQPAKITLDAYSGIRFDAAVIQVDPAATTISGVNSYKVTLQFNDNDPRIKQGMGANVRIQTASRKSVIAIPNSAIIIRGADKIVLDESGKERKIETGIEGAEGYIEIVSGLSDKDRIAAFGQVR